MDTFPCTKCGECCKNIGGIVQLEEFNDGKGVCSKYDKDSGCTIYNSRPLICRIDEGFKLFHKLFKDRQSYFEANAKVCNQLQLSNEVDVIYRVYINNNEGRR